MMRRLLVYFFLLFSNSVFGQDPSGADLFYSDSAASSPLLTGFQLSPNGWFSEVDLVVRDYHTLRPLAFVRVARYNGNKLIDYALTDMNGRLHLGSAANHDQFGMIYCLMGAQKVERIVYYAQTPGAGQNTIYLSNGQGFTRGISPGDYYLPPLKPHIIYEEGEDSRHLKGEAVLNPYAEGRRYRRGKID